MVPGINVVYKVYIVYKFTKSKIRENSCRRVIDPVLTRRPQRYGFVETRRD